jgi:hypothetical protein
MLSVSRGQTARFKFSFNSGTSYYDPLLANPHQDIYASVIRGLNGYGSIIQPAISIINSSYRVISVSSGTEEGVYTYITVGFDVSHNLSIGQQVILYGVGGNYDREYTVHQTPSTSSVVLKAVITTTLSLSSFNSSLFVARLCIKNSSYIYRTSNSEYEFVYQVPEEFVSGNYTVVIKTSYGSVDQTLEINFNVLDSKYEKSAKVNATQISNGIATIFTNEIHGIKTGDYISIEDVNTKFNGKYYVSSTPTNKSLSFPLNLQNQARQSLDQLGLVKLVDYTGISPSLSGPNQPTKVSYRPKFNDLQPFSTNSILLVGHADGLELNDPIRIQSVQEAVNLLGANMKSPLLRGVLEAYNSGARDIFICAVAPMSEYVDYTQNRNEKLNFLLSNEATPVKMSFYEKYYERLNNTYNVLRYYEFIDIIVPLETSIIDTGDVDFISQLALYLDFFHNETGFVQIGIIGSRSNGVKDSDVSILETNNIFISKYTFLDGNTNEIASDIGRFVIPVYGEINFSHIGFQNSYVGTAAAAYAGLVSTTPVYNGLIRKRLPAGYSLYGSNLSRESLLKLDNLGINTIYRTTRANRGNPYEVYISNDYTLASRESVFFKLPQMRLAAMVINEIKSIGYDSIGKFAYDTITAKVRSMLDLLVATKAIRDYSLDAFADRYIKGYMIFQLTLISSSNLSNIKFSVSAGPGA